MGVETKKLARTESEPIKEIADFAKTHPYEYMRKCLEQFRIGETRTMVLIDRKFKEILNEYQISI